jgi:hypothetical protein
MTLTQLVYNVGQYRLRQRLKAEETTLPDQLGKQIQNPTLRWIFQIMEEIGLVRFYNESLSHIVKEVVTNINAVRKEIIYLFGKTAAKIYGLIPKVCAGGLGM